MFSLGWVVVCSGLASLFRDADLLEFDVPLS